MASRIRTLKPDFWTSEQIVSCSRDARLLFIGLWNFSDDAGVHPASHLRLKMEVFPGDNCTEDNIKRWLNELIKNGLVREYVANNEPYWIVTGWKKHQRIDRPTYRYPLPESEEVKITKIMPASPKLLAEDSTSPRRIINEPSTTDWNGVESNGKDIDTCEVETSPFAISTNLNKVFEHWRATMGHPRAKLDKKRNSKINAALKLGYTVHELLQAIDGCSKTPFNMGQNDRSQRYDSIELIFRDADHIDRFINNALSPPQLLTNLSKLKADCNDVFAGII